MNLESKYRNNINIENHKVVITNLVIIPEIIAQDTDQMLEISENNNNDKLIFIAFNILPEMEIGEHSCIKVYYLYLGYKYSFEDILPGNNNKYVL